MSEESMNIYDEALEIRKRLNRLNEKISKLEKEEIKIYKELEKEKEAKINRIDKEIINLYEKLKREENEAKRLKIKEEIKELEKQAIYIVHQIEEEKRYRTSEIRMRKDKIWEEIKQLSATEDRIESNM